MNIRSIKIKLFLSAFLIFVQAANATTVAQIGSEELVNNSELIFQGIVLSVDSQLNSKGTIHTYVTFEIEDLIVGDASIENTPLILRFTGGTVGSQRLDVGATIPSIGERGVYFVERVRFGLINPILGWEQGVFTINEEGLVVASNSSPVMSIQRVPTPQALRISNGIADGIVTRSSTSGSTVTNPPMDLIQFKKQILELKD